MFGWLFRIWPRPLSVAALTKAVNSPDACRVERMSPDAAIGR
ncbi:MAG: hypothetical protein WDM92_15875 [Caulobacteraceae bacterium]